jgi:hypothetical protein
MSTLLAATTAPAVAMPAQKCSVGQQADHDNRSSAPQLWRHGSKNDGDAVPGSSGACSKALSSSSSNDRSFRAVPSAPREITVPRGSKQFSVRFARAAAFISGNAMGRCESGPGRPDREICRFTTPPNLGLTGALSCLPCACRLPPSRSATSDPLALGGPGAAPAGAEARCQPHTTRRSKSNCRQLLVRETGPPGPKDRLRWLGATLQVEICSDDVQLQNRRMCTSLPKQWPKLTYQQRASGSDQALFHSKDAPTELEGLRAARMRVEEYKHVQVGGVRVV